MIVRRMARPVLSLGSKAIGPLVKTLMPAYSRRLMSKWPEGGPKTGIQMAMYKSVLTAQLTEYYRHSTTTARREELKANCMGRESGVRWAQHYGGLSFPETYTSRIAMFSLLDEAMAAGDIESVHQVACSSGREIAYFAGRYPGIKFVGSDMDDSIVEYCRNRWENLDNLSFAVVRLERLDPKERDSLKADIVFCSGGLQYLDEDSVRGFLTHWCHWQIGACWLSL